MFLTFFTLIMKTIIIKINLKNFLLNSVILKNLKIGHNDIKNKIKYYQPSIYGLYF